jgi:hypothetical protein
MRAPSTGDRAGVWAGVRWSKTSLPLLPPLARSFNACDIGAPGWPIPIEKEAAMPLAHSLDSPTAGRPQVSAPDREDGHPLFPGWRWAIVVALAFPLAGLIGWAIGGHVDAVGPALLGGALTGAGLGAAQWFAAKEMFGRWPAWVGASAAGYCVGLAAGAALVGYETSLGALAAMGAVSGAALGAAQGLVLAAQARKRFAAAWAVAMPVLFAVGWSVTTLSGIDVDKQFTVFGAAGALVFMLLSGLLVARFMRSWERVS